MVNLRLAFRTLFKTPFVTAVTVASLALGIGANAAIYSLFNQIILRPLPVKEPARLVNLVAGGPKSGSMSCNQAGDCDAVLSYPMYRDLERGQSAFAGIAAHRAFGASLAFRNQTQSTEGMFVSGSYFDLLGLRPALGRLLTTEDDQTLGGHPAAVLSHSYWETRHGADPAVLNEQIVVNGQSLTIVGVAPAGFEGTTLGANPRVFVPISMRGLLEPRWRGNERFENRRDYWIYSFARLMPGATMEQAQRAINGLYQPIITDVEAPLQTGMSDQRLQAFRQKAITLEDGRRGQSSIHTEASTPLLLLFSITGIVLLIACANIANLLLARGASRSMEMAVRLSLGAGRRQILAQLLTESVLLALVGGAVSLLVARWTLGFIASTLPADAAAALTFGVNPAVIAFAGAVSVLTGVVFGLFPALHSTRADLVTVLRANTGQPSGARGAARFRTGLVTAQMALSMTLLVLAGLFVKSLVNVSRVELGVKTEHVITFGLSPELVGYDSTRSRALFERVEQELAALPGVSDVATAMVPILSGSNWTRNVSVEGFRADPDANTNAAFNMVGPGYLRALGVSLRAGRDFTLADDAGAPRVAIVNEAFARKFNLGQDVVGKRMGMGQTADVDIQIVGVIPDIKYGDVKEEIPAQFIIPWRQDRNVGTLQFYVRGAIAPEKLAPTIPPIIARLDGTLPVENLKTMRQQVRETVFLDRMISTLSAAFALLATVLAAVGLYGVLSYTVAQRTREIGVRMALGADRGRVRRMVMRQVATMTLAGAVVGLAAALGIGRLARSMLFGLEGNDPFVIAAAAGMLTLVAFIAGEIPAMRASRVDPMQALRWE